MGGKHLKRLRAEKAKVKLKQKKLPKGQNITDTSFKVKQISIPEQLKKSDEHEVLSSRNLSLKDSLTHLNHYNASSRLNGLAAIEELILKHPEILQGVNLRSIVVGVLELVNDVEHKVRKTGIELLSTLFYQLSADQIVPFHDILNVHLGCAMTHIDISIQKDSLLLLDIIVEHTPDVLKKNYKNMIRNFVRILSGQRYGSSAELFLVKGSKSGLAASKIAILSRLHKILSIVFENIQETSKFLKDIKADVEHGFSLRSTSRKFKEVSFIASFFKPGIGESENVNSENEEIQSYISTVMPLLFDTWIEFAPAKQSDGFSSELTLNEDASKILMLLLQIMMLFYEYIFNAKLSALNTWFITNYRNMFSNAFLQNFPYVPPAKLSKNEQNDFEVRDGMNMSSQAYVSQNLLLCYFYYSFNIKLKSKEVENKMEKYITGALQTRSKTGVESDVLIKVVNAVLKITKRPQRTDLVLSATVKAYMCTNKNELRSGLFNILKDIALDDRLVHLHQNRFFSAWIQTLPGQLCKNNVSIDLVEVILKLLSRKTDSGLLKEIECRASDIVRLLPYVRVKGVDEVQGRKRIADTIFWCSEDTIKSIIKKKILEDKGYPSELRSYLIDILSEKISN